MRALIVDDESSIRILLKYLLEKRGFQVYQAASIGQAQEVAGVVQPELVLLDLALPDASGLIFLRWLQLQAFEPAVVVLSVLNRLKYGSEAIRLGASAWISKPFQIQNLLNTVVRVVGLHPSVNSSKNVNEGVVGIA
ncbi:MAG: response regulator [Elusimicrobia bacterium]|nr:response regulator [Elusimicrobiota bacterium]